jgi:hypothetical protein
MNPIYFLLSLKTQLVESYHQEIPIFIMELLSGLSSKWNTGFINKKLKLYKP